MSNSPRLVALLALFSAAATTQGLLLMDANQRGPMMAAVRKMADAYRDKPLVRAIRNGKQVCYEDLGCFSKMPPLKKAPQSPSDLDTKFFLYTRSRRQHSADGPRQEQQQEHEGFQEKEIRYDDGGTSLSNSGLRAELPTRIVVHGFKGSLKDEGAVRLVDNLLKIEDSNVVIVDWEKGAQGPSYIVSAANTQLVGRQLALLIMDILATGVASERIHLIGFSLGAHIAGYAGRAVRQATGSKLGRITGLDPASPLFREFLKASLISLNVEDAEIVDVIHTDGAPRWPSGFGLWKVIGHVDFFPNGGRDQPGCTHVPASLIVSHFEGVVNSSIVCNHARGFQLFLESTQPLVRGEGTQGAPPCLFRSFPCRSKEHFSSGNCFPKTCLINATDGSCSVMGMEATDKPARGPMYLVTRDKPPFCGDQLQGNVAMGRLTGGRARGTLTMRLLHHDNETTLFPLHHHSREPLWSGNVVSSVAAAKYGVTSGADKMRALLGWRGRQRQEPPGGYRRPNKRQLQIRVQAVQIADMDSNLWSWCNGGGGVILSDVDGSGWETAVVQLRRERQQCSDIFETHRSQQY